MKKSIIYTGISSMLIALMLISVSCEDLFNDPLKDKESGEDITVLLLDRNFIKTKLLIWFVDAKTDEPIENEYIEVQIWGENSDNLITFNGEKPEVFYTEIGLLELGYDPNYTVNSDNPLAITIMAIGESGISAPQFVSFTQEGTKDIIIKMNKTEMGEPLKAGAFGEPFDISYNGVLHSSDLNYITDISGSPTGTEYEYINLYNTMAAGSILCDNLQNEYLYDDFGIYFTSSSTGTSLVPPALPVKSEDLAGGDYVFSTIRKADVVMCETGLTLKIERNDGLPGTGTFEYLITFSSGDVKEGQVSGSFPISQLIEPIYYPGSDPAVTVQLIGDTQYDVSEPISLSSVCGESASFIATPKQDLHKYKFINQYICPDSPIGVALSVNGQFRKSETGDPWTSFEFIEGICELEIEEGVEYDFRVPIDGEYQHYTLPTDPDQLEAFLNENQGEEYSIIELSITPDADLTVVYAIVQVSESVCSSLNGPGGSN